MGATRTGNSIDIPARSAHQWRRVRWLGQPSVQRPRQAIIRLVQRSCAMGDKGKKDKDKNQKQKGGKQSQKAKQKQGKQQPRVP
jgi:hypothetical protein